MPESAPGQRQSVTVTKANVHGNPAVEEGNPGIIAKSEQAAPAAVSAANATAAKAIGVGEEAVIFVTGKHGFSTDLLPGAAAVGDALWIRVVDNVLLNRLDAEAAGRTLTTGVIGSNNAILWTGKEDDDVVRVSLINAGASQSLSVDVDGPDIIVNLATSGGSAITSTAAQVIAAVLEHDTASQMVTATNKGASNGTGIVAAVAATALADNGGEDGSGVVKFGKLVELDDVIDRCQVNLNLRDTF